MKFKVTNWAEYDAGLRRRGSLTLWVTDEAIAGWQAAPRPTGRCCMDIGLVEGSPPQNFRTRCFDYGRSLAVRHAACG